MANNKNFLTAEEVAESMGISVKKAYGLVKQLNDELKSQGCIIFPGKINRQYLERKISGDMSKSNGTDNI